MIRLNQLSPSIVAALFLANGFGMTTSALAEDVKPNIPSEARQGAAGQNYQSDGSISHDAQNQNIGVNNSQSDRQNPAGVLSGREGSESERARMGATDKLDEKSSSDQDTVLQNSATAYTNLLNRTGVPRDLLSKANCVAIIPEVKSRALVIGRQTGKGVLSCKTEDNSWSLPAFIKLSQTSLGAQVGIDSKEMVFFVVGDDEADKFTDGDVKFGSDLSVTAGPVGTTHQQGLNLKNGVYSYASDERGLFAGVALTGGSLSVDKESNTAYYGTSDSIAEMLQNSDTSEANSATRKFIESLPN